MPLINGLKMACEPCIRGHRSTKCTHANERLMVPVRKPGRPLSACPHPRDQRCGCGSITAAIPRNQACHCGTPASETPPMMPRPISSLSDLPSPTKTSFKIQKNTRPGSSRKQSISTFNLERMDMNLVSLQSFAEQKPQPIPAEFMSGYAMASSAPVFGFTSQYAEIQSQYGMVPVQTLAHVDGNNGSLLQGPGTNGFRKALDTNMDMTVPTTFGAFESGRLANVVSHVECGEGGLSGDIKPMNGGSCCAPPQNSHSSSSSTSSIPDSREAPKSSRCSSKNKDPSLKMEPPNDTSINNTPQIPHQSIPQNGISFNPEIYQQIAPQPNVFTYPPTYGSYQNPLQPAAWREGIQSSYASAEQAMLPGSLPFDVSMIATSYDTVHSCSCGDSCQCIGCAAHPYNDATQNYVRSAWEMSSERSPSEVIKSDQPITNGAIDVPSPPAAHPADSTMSPTPPTPTSMISGNGDDQNLSADNFLFVNYPFTGDGCGGEMSECPCGDNCDCIGCVIHGNVPMPNISCCGVESAHLCGDECDCVGCELHKRSPGGDSAIEVKGSCCQ